MSQQPLGMPNGSTATEASCIMPENQGLRVAKGKIQGRAPLVFPSRCVRCGNDASAGRRVTTTVYSYPVWVWLGLLVGLIGVVLLYLVARRPAELSYSLCPHCIHSEKIKKATALGMWGLAVLCVVGTVATLGNRELMTGAIVLLVAGMIVYYATGLRIGVVGFKNGVFTLRGAGQGFLATLR